MNTYPETPNEHLAADITIAGNPTPEETAAVLAVIYARAKQESELVAQAHHNQQQSIWSPERRARAIQKLSTYYNSRLSFFRR